MKPHGAELCIQCKECAVFCQISALAAYDGSGITGYSVVFTCAAGQRKEFCTGRGLAKMAVV